MDWKRKRRKKISRLIPRLSTLALLIFLLFASNLISQQATKSIIDAYEKDIKKNSIALDSIKLELNRGRKRVNELASREGDYLKQLNQLESNMNSSQKYINLLSNRIDTLNINISTLNDSIKIYSTALKIRQKKMEKRLKNIYMTGNPTLLEILFSSRNIGDALAKVKYFKTLYDYDKSLLYIIDSTNNLVISKKRLQEVDLKEVTLRLNEKKDEQQLLGKEKNSRTTMLAKVRNEKGAYVNMIKELETVQKEFNFLVSRLEKKKKNAKLEYEQNLKIAFAKRKGKLPWPAKGEVITKYGKIVHPVYKTVTMNNGIDISATKGDGVFSVAPGEVDYIGTMRGYGKFVIVNHFGGYMTIYAHLNTINVKMGKEVKYGTLLGTAGESGSLNGVKVHFQIRKATKTVNPLSWLEKRGS